MDNLPPLLLNLLSSLHDSLPPLPPQLQELMDPLPFPPAFYIAPFIICILASIILSVLSRNPPPRKTVSSPPPPSPKTPIAAWLGNVDPTQLYSLKTSISTGATKQLISPMSLRSLTPNNVHVKVGHWSDVGQRGYQEDRYTISEMGVNREGEKVSMIGVFDGHGGQEASQYLADRLLLYVKNAREFPDGDIGAVLTKAFMDIDEDFIKTGKPDGSTVNVCIVVGNSRVICANAGDSRSVLVKKNGDVVALSKDHKPGDPDETKRITDLGGSVVYWGRWRVQSVLAVSRSVGDAALMPYITAEPNIVEHVIGEDDLFIVTASDGIWDVMENEAVGKFICREMTKEGEVTNDDELLKFAGRKLCVESGKLGSGDNVTAVVASLKD